MIYKLKLINVLNKIKNNIVHLSQIKNGFSQLVKRISYIKEKKIIILYISGVIFYCISLTHLSGIGMRCFFWEGEKCYYALGILISISSFLTSLAIYIIFFKKYKSLHFLNICIIYTFLYLIDHNAEIVKHGLFNFILFIITTFTILLFICYCHLLFYLIKKRKYFIFFIFSIPFPALFILLKIYKLTHFSCNNWGKGLNNTFIDNLSKNYPCNIILPKPHSCYLSEIGHFFNFVDRYTPTCSDSKLIQFEKEKFLKDLEKLKYLNISNKMDFGYPLTNNEKYNPNKFGCIFSSGNISFEEFINENIILLDLYNKNKSLYYENTSKPEIEVHLNKEDGKILINISRNETLVKEREKSINKNKIIYKNVLVMFFDTLSRSHFFRKFPKTSNFLNQFSKYEENYSKKNMTIFQYFKYHSLRTYTDPNVKAAYYGSKIYGKGVHFVNYYRANGYIVGRVNAFCEKEIIFDKKNYSSFNHGIWDHEGLSLGCITAFYDRFLTSRLSSVVRKCLFGKELNQYALDYLESFWTTYLEQNKMFLYQSVDGHEPTGEYIGYFDEKFFNFLNKFYINGLFKDTAIILFSDHGQHLSGPFYLLDSQDFYSERSLPILFLIIPNNDILYKDNLYEKIKGNQQIFITPYDIYNTLLHIAFGDINEEYKKNSILYGGSLLTKLNYKLRYCESSFFDSEIYLGICRCKIIK